MKASKFVAVAFAKNAFDEKRLVVVALIAFKSIAKRLVNDPFDAKRFVDVELVVEAFVANKLVAVAFTVMRSVMIPFEIVVVANEDVPLTMKSPAIVWLPINVVDPIVAVLNIALFPMKVVALATLKIPVIAEKFVADALMKVDVVA